MSKRTFYIIYIIYSTLIDRDAYFVFFRIVEIIYTRIHSRGTAKFSFYITLREFSWLPGNTP